MAPSRESPLVNGRKKHQQEFDVRLVRVGPQAKQSAEISHPTHPTKVKSLPVLFIQLYSLPKHDKPGTINYLAWEIESKWFKIHLSSDVNNFGAFMPGVLQKDF